MAVAWSDLEESGVRPLVRATVQSNRGLQDLSFAPKTLHRDRVHGGFFSLTLSGCAPTGLSFGSSRGRFPHGPTEPWWSRELRTALRRMQRWSFFWLLVAKLAVAELDCDGVTCEVESIHLLQHAHTREVRKSKARG